ncbi:MAG: hypothetical protein EBU90_28750, partial [Proteobacteria bacterium]|nr:hypothetical protein [Pseudomonadota bacterium]
AASSTQTGALTVAGGVGIGQNLYVGGQENNSNLTNATSTSTGALTVAGGVGIGQNLYVGGGVQVTGRFTSTGIANVTNTTDAISTSSGALVISGGVGIAYRYPAVQVLDRIYM